MNPLQSRLSALRRGLRWVVLSRGVGGVLVLLLAAALAAMALDWYLNLPALVRALLLVGMLSGAGYVAFQFLFAPLATRMDDLSLALRVEEQYPALNDALASTVQFLQQPAEEAAADSPSLRREAVQRAMRIAQGCDFRSIIDRRGVGIIVGTTLLLGAVAAYVFLSYPLAPTALARLVEPFGDHTWTTLAVEPCPTRVAQKRPYVIRGKVGGEVPGSLTIEIEGQGVKRVALKPDDEAWTTASFSAPLDMTKQQGEFRFRVVANDASFPPQAGAWHKVQVVPPPRLVLLNGRQSPQLEYYFPAYTDLPSPYQVSPGAKNIEVLAGTQVVYRAAVDRPVEKAWIEFRPRDDGAKPALIAGTVAAPHTLDLLTRLAGGHAVWGKVVPETAPNRTQLTFRFQPWVTGNYALRLEDADALVLDDEADLQVLADPIPQVALLQPSGKQTLLATAGVPLRIVAEDELFALRSVFLEVRRKDREGKVDVTRRLPLYHHRATADFVAAVPGTVTWPLALPGGAFRLRPKQLEIDWRWPLAGFARDGDILYVQACADDFNNVAPFNPPGRSIEVELHIIGKAELAKLLDDRLADVQKDLVNVQKMQEQAAKAVKKVQDDLAKQDKKADPKEQEKLLDRLIEAEQTQKQIQKQVGAKQDEGLRDKLAKIRQMLRDNQLPPSNVQDRVRTLDHELERLADQDFPQIEQKLAEARKELNAKLNGKDTPPKKDNPLDKAQSLQQDAKRAIDDLVRFLDPWANMHQVKTQAQDLLDKQRDLKKDTQKLGAKPNPEDVAKAVENQQNLSERLQDLLNKMKEVGDKRKEEGDKQTAERLRDAAAEAAKNQIDEAMKGAKADLDNKNPINGKSDPMQSQALKNQQKAIDGLEKMIAALGDRRDEDVQKLLQKQMAEEAKLAELLQKQEALQKKTKQKLEEQDLLAKKKKQIEDELAKKKRDPAEAKAALEKIQEGMKKNQADLNKLAQEQRELQKLVQEKARELGRMQAEQAGKAMNKAAQEMERAAQLLEKGENPDEAQQEARDRLEDAQDQLQDAQEELLREQLAKIADRLKGLKERQDAAVKEMVRLHADSVEKAHKWTAGQLRSLGDLADTQKAIAREAESMKEKLKGAKVFERILERAAKNMDDAAEAISNRREKGRTQILADEELADENKTQELTLKHQSDASKRLQRLLDALKDDPIAKRPQQPKEDANGGGQPDNKLGGPGDGIPDIAQLKALREEQQELNDRTRAFVERQLAILVAGGGAVTPTPVGADATPMSPAQRTELGQLEAEQAGLRELFDLITRPPERGQKEQP